MGKIRIARKKRRGEQVFPLQKKDNNNIWQNSPFTPQQQSNQSNNLANTQKRLQLAKQSNFDFSQIPLRSPQSNSNNIQRDTENNYEVIQADFFDRFRSQESIDKRNQRRALEEKALGGEYRNKKSYAWAFTKDWAKTLFWNWSKNYDNRNEVIEHNRRHKQSLSDMAKNTKLLNRIRALAAGSPFLKTIDPNASSIDFHSKLIFTGSSKQGYKIKDRSLFNVLDTFAEYEFSNENTFFMNQMHHLQRSSILQMMAIADVCVNTYGGASSKYAQYLPVAFNAHRPSEIDTSRIEVNVSYKTRQDVMGTFQKVDKLLNGQRGYVPMNLKLDMMDGLNKANGDIFNLMNDTAGRFMGNSTCVYAITQAAGMDKISTSGGVPGGMTKARIRQGMGQKRRMNRGY